LLLYTFHVEVRGEQTFMYLRQYSTFNAAEEHGTNGLVNMWVHTS